MNQVVLTGILDHNPESLDPGLGAFFVLKVREPRDPGAPTKRIRLACWSELADFALTYLAAGDEILLYGRLGANDRDGVPGVEIEIDAIEFLKVAALAGADHLADVAVA